MNILFNEIFLVTCQKSPVFLICKEFPPQHILRQQSFCILKTKCFCWNWWDSFFSVITAKGIFQREIGVKNIWMKNYCNRSFSREVALLRTIIPITFNADLQIKSTPQERVPDYFRHTQVSCKCLSFNMITWEISTSNIATVTHKSNPGLHK